VHRGSTVGGIKKRQVVIVERARRNEDDVDALGARVATGVAWACEPMSTARVTSKPDGEARLRARRFRLAFFLLDGREE
jgi:hypothetical protein